MKLFGASLLTLSLLSSFVCGVVILILIYLNAVDIWVAIGLTILINIILWLIGPWITDHMNMWFYKVQFLKKDEVEKKYPDVFQLITAVATQHNFPFPKVGIIPDKNPTAYTYGSARYNSRIIITEGIFEYLNPSEVKAVLAHELGHIVNRDFIVMMVASTLVQILYEIYAVLIRAKGKKSGNAKLIALLSYGLYIVSTYMLYYLSRTRETLADEFSASITSSQDLANALIKIAYGIVAVDDTDSSKRLLESTRHLGIIDVKNAKHIGAISYITHNDPNVLAEVMVFDRVSPWAKLIELSSTHPLTGNRLNHLSVISKKSNHPFSYDIDGAIQRLQVKTSLLYSNFFVGVVICFAPLLTAVLSLLVAPVQFLPAAMGIGLLVQLFYKYPMEVAEDTTVLAQMRNPYASPVRGKVISLKGKVIGKGMPGYIFSEDMMYQDSTGLTFLDYNSLFGFIGNLFFALGKIKKLFAVNSVAEGWFFRGMGSLVALRYIKTDTEIIRSHPILWSFIFPLLLIIASMVWIYISTTGQYAL